MTQKQEEISFETCWDELSRGEHVRQNLSSLRSILREKGDRQGMPGCVGDGADIIGLLSDKEPKVRKNAALLLGDLGLCSAVGELYAHYESEETLFVKSAYLAALQKLDASAYIEAFKARRKELASYVPAEEEKKHIAAELRQLEELIAGIEGIGRHRFIGFDAEQKFLLTANHRQSEVILEETAKISASVKRSAKLHPLGVLVKSQKLLPFVKLRTYRELLLCVPVKERVKATPEDAVNAVWKSGIYQMLSACMEGGEVFYFRLDVRSAMGPDEKSAFVKAFAQKLEAISGRRFVNAPKSYEIEFRLIAAKESGFLPFVRIPSLTAGRFSYRRNVVSASIHPSLAAVLAALARPYLKEDAKILDPFCGVGTMLIERDILVPAREKYGVDIYDDAIKFARENAAAAGEQIHFIHRDYFDFRHSHRFDEIIANMPLRGRKTKEEMDEFYRRFFEKSREHLAKEATLILYANEVGFIKKQLRLRRDYRLLQEFVIREKEQFHLFIIRAV